MPYFDGRERGLDEQSLRRVREKFNSDVSGETAAYFTGQDVEVEQIHTVGSSKTVKTVGVAPEYLYPRPPTEDLARELYMNGDLTDDEFEHVVEQALILNGVEWGDV